MSDSFAEYQLRLATILAGAVKFNEQNVNDTFRGQILTASGTVESAIIKDLTPRELGNELLAAAFASLLNLPIPDCYLAVVPAGVLNVSKGPQTEDGEQLVFASVDANAQSLRFRVLSSISTEQQRLLKELTEWAQLGDLYAFDAWVANVDRNPGNLLYAGKDKVWIIDHGQCFSGPAWEKQHLVSNQLYRHRLKEWLTSHIELAKRPEHAKVAKEFCALIDQLDVAEAINSSGAGPLSVEDDMLALKQFLVDRKPEVPNKTADALGVLLL